MRNIFWYISIYGFSSMILVVNVYVHIFDTMVCGNECFVLCFTIAVYETGISELRGEEYATDGSTGS